MSLESKASDHKYCYLSVFESWVNNTTFYPIPNTMSVKVVVELNCVEETLVRGSACDDCKRKAVDTGLMDLVAAVNWGEINLFNVENIVSLFLLRAVPHFLLGIAMNIYFIWDLKQWAYFDRMSACIHLPQVLEV